MITSALCYTHVHQDNFVTSVKKHFPIHKLEAKELFVTIKVSFVKTSRSNRHMVWELAYNLPID